jgi:hypothetical protein
MGNIVKLYCHDGLCPRYLFYISFSYYSHIVGHGISLDFALTLNEKPDGIVNSPRKDHTKKA